MRFSFLWLCGGGVAKLVQRLFEGLEKNQSDERWHVIFQSYIVNLGRKTYQRPLEAVSLQNSQQCSLSMFHISRGSVLFIYGIVSNTASVEIIEWSRT